MLAYLGQITVETIYVIGPQKQLRWVAFTHQVEETGINALPIVGLMLEVYGPGAGDFELDVEAIFLGAPIMRMRGQCVVLSGPTSREPLVGLKIGFAIYIGAMSSYQTVYGALAAGVLVYVGLWLAGVVDAR